MAITISPRVYNEPIVFDGEKRFRGAQVFGVSASTLTLRVALEANLVGTRHVPRSFAPQAILGDAAALEVTGDGAESYVVVAIHPAPFASPAGNNDSVSRGEFCPGRIVHELTGDQGYVPWTAGLQTDRSR